MIPDDRSSRSQFAVIGDDLLVQVSCDWSAGHDTRL